MFGHRFAMVAEEEGKLQGFVVAFPARLWGSLRLGTGVILARAAGVRHVREVVSRGRLLDRLHPPPPRETLYVSALAVVPEFRRRGIARALMERVIGGATGLGLGISLDVDLDNEAARKLYESLGFRETGVRETRESEREVVQTPGFARLTRPLSG